MSTENTLLGLNFGSKEDTTNLKGIQLGVRAPALCDVNK
jgi:hypothetical protein